MINDPVGVLVLLASFTYWWFAIFYKKKSDIKNQPSTDSDESKSKAGAFVASIGIFLFMGFVTSIGIYSVIQDIPKSPAKSVLSLLAIGGVLWLLIAKPDRFAILLVGAIVLFGSIGLLGNCSGLRQTDTDGMPYYRK